MAAARRFPAYGRWHHLKFFVNDGWTMELLESCCKRGHVKKLLTQGDDPCFVLEHGSAFNARKLIEHISTLYRDADPVPGESDLQYILRLNY